MRERRGCQPTSREASNVGLLDRRHQLNRQLGLVAKCNKFSQEQTELSKDPMSIYQQLS